MAAFAVRMDQRITTFERINVTPLVDVLLVLLIIFMLAKPLLTQHLSLNFAHCTGACRQPTAADAVDLSIKQTGEMYWNGIAINRAELARNFAILAQQREPPRLTPRPEPATKYDLVADVLTTAKNANLQQIGIEPTRL